MEHFELLPGDDDPRTFALDVANVLPRRISQLAREAPGVAFLVEADTGTTVTYGAFWDTTRRWARLLRDAGIEAGDRVATLLPSSIDAHAVWLATSLLGAYEVPINPELRGDFLDHVLTDAAIALCVVRPEFESVIAGSGVDGVGVLVAPIDTPMTDRVEPLAIDRLPAPDDVSCVIYTSGTTGPAKGVIITWAQMSANLGRIPRRWLSSNDAVYSCWPMFHVTGRSPMVSMSDVGGRVVLRQKFSLPDFWSDVRHHGCTSTTAGTAALLLAQPAHADDADNPLRFVLFGKVGRQGLRFMERFDTAGLAFYGSTEVGFPIGYRPIAAGDHEAAGFLRPGYEARIVDGELWIRPPDRRLIMRGYLGQPERTSQAIVDGWYRTGDAVRRRDDGAFVFVDRLRDTIRRFGENISSTALESAVLADPDVVECAAIGVPSPVTGQEVMLFAVLRDGASRDPQALAERLGELLPRYMRPAYISIVDELPKTPTGKVRKVALDTDVTKAWSAR